MALKTQDNTDSNRNAYNDDTQWMGKQLFRHCRELMDLKGRTSNIQVIWSLNEETNVLRNLQRVTNQNLKSYKNL